MNINDRKPVNASDLFLSVSGNQVWGSRGDFAIGYKIEYPETYSLGEVGYVELHSAWVRVIRNLPTGTIMVKSDVFLKDHFDTSQFPDRTFLQKATKRHFQGREYMRHYAYVFFVNAPYETFKNNTIKNPFVFPSIQKSKEDDLRMEAFVNEVTQAADILGQSRLVKLQPLSEEEIIAFRDFYFNGFQGDYFTDLEFENDHFTADDKTIGMYSLCNEEYLPPFTQAAYQDADFSSPEKGFIFYRGMMDNLGLSLDCSHIYNQIVFVDDHKAHVDKIQDNINQFYYNTLNAQNKVIAKELESYQEEIANDTFFRYVRAHENIIFWTEDSNSFFQYKQKIAALLKTLDLKPVYPTGIRLQELLYSSFFINVSCLSNPNLYLVDLRVAACFFMNTTNYKNDPEGILFNDRIFNIPVRHDIWDAKKVRKKSRNFAVIARTGGGKSVTMQHILRQLIEEDNVVVIIIDLGRSYVKMAHLFPKDQVSIYEYEPNKPLGINPFALEDNEELSSLKIEILCQFIWAIIKKKTDPSDVEESSLRKIIHHYYMTEDEEYSWESFYSFVRDNKDNLYALAGIEDKDMFNVKELLQIGGDFIGDGIYANLFKKSDQVSEKFIGKKLIIFELSEVKSNPMLLTVILMMISDVINKVIWKDQSTRGEILYEEFSTQLKFPEVLARVTGQMETIRKQNSAAGIVLQTINQLPADDPLAKTILDNIETYIFLESGNYRDAIERLKLDKHDQSQLNSLQSNFSGQRRYSEIYIKEGNYGNVFRIELPKMAYLAYQTEGEIHEELLKSYEQTGDMETSIREYMQKHNIDE